MEKIKILLVEDEAIVALQIKNALAIKGHTVVGIYSSGEQALESLATITPDLVLMDIRLRGKMDGIKTAERICAARDVPVIFLTASSEESAVHRAKTTSPYGYLLKPVREQDLHIGIQLAFYKHELDLRVKNMERHYAAVLRGTGEAVITADRECRVTLMNPGAENCTGWRKENAMGKRIAEVVAVKAGKSEKVSMEEHLLTEVVKEGRTVNLFDDRVIFKRDGTELAVDGNAAPIRDEQNNIVGIVMSFRDATERKMAEEALKKSHEELESRVMERTRDLNRANAQLMAEVEERNLATAALQESQERYRRITDTITDCIYTVHVEDNIPVKTVYSPAYEAVTGYSPEELAADPGLWLRMVDETFQEAVLAYSQEIFRSAFTPPSIEYQIIRKDGNRCWIRNTLVPFRDSKGNLRYYDGLLQDITELKHSEAQILHSQKMLQAVFDAISDPLILVDRNMTIRMLNTAAVQYYRIVSPQDLIGKSGCMGFCAKRNPSGRCILHSMISGTDKEMSFERKGCIELEKIESVTLFPVPGEKAEDADTVIRISDITEERMIEKAMIRSQKLASIGVLSSGIAHEINNPNNFIMFNVPVLRRYLRAMLCVIKEHAAVQADSALFGMSLEEFERDLLDLADSIEKGSERIKTIVDELKDFSCLGEQTETLSGNPAQTIAQAVRICRVQLKSKVRNLYINIPKGLPNAYFEVKGLEQTIVNILINAAQAADKQDSWVRLKAMIVDNGKRYFVIEISDNGCGMEANNLKKIFDPFYTTKPSGQGTGLGLYVCHNLIEKMGGHMDVESSLGKGSTFKIMLRCE